MDKRVIDWVRKRHSSGFSKDAISKKLLDSGLHLENVESIMKEALGDGSQKTGGKKRNLATALSIILILAIISAAIGIFAWNYFNPSPEKILKSIKQEIIPNIVSVECLDQFSQPIGTGSGFFSLEENNTPIIETNAHVAIADDGNFYGCWVYFPREDGSFYDSVYFTNLAYLYHDMASVVNENAVNGIDYAKLVLTEAGKDENGVSFVFPPEKSGFWKSIGKVCRERYIEFADRIYVLGYPAIGRESLTITEGVISGFLGDFIKVSASINPGNSGGAAIGANDGCMYGIPTQYISDESGSIGQLLSYTSVNDFIGGLTGNKANFSISEDEKEFLSYENPELGIRIRYPPEIRMEEGAYIKFILPPLTAIDRPEKILNLATEDLSGNQLSLEEYVNLSIENLKYAFIGFSLSSSERTDLGGIPAIKITHLSGDYSKVKVVQIVAIKNNTAYIISFGSEEPGFEIVEGIFQRMIDTFEFI